MSVFELKMPKLGESVTEGTIGKWLKQPGEKVEKYDLLVEVQTDKVNTEIRSPARSRRSTSKRATRSRSARCWRRSTRRTRPKRRRLLRRLRRRRRRGR